MAVAMTSLTRAKNGDWFARKGIPESVIALRSTIKAAAQLTVIENDVAGPRFGNYRPPPAEMPVSRVRGMAKTAETKSRARGSIRDGRRRPMTGGLKIPEAEDDPATIAHIQEQLTALRAAGLLSPEGCRLLAQAEAVEAANSEMDAVRERLESRMKEIDAEVRLSKKTLQ